MVTLRWPPLQHWLPNESKHYYLKYETLQIPAMEQAQAKGGWAAYETRAGSSKGYWVRISCLMKLCIGFCFRISSDSAQQRPNALILVFENSVLASQTKLWMLLKRLKSQMPVSIFFFWNIFSVLPNQLINFVKLLSKFEIAWLESHHTLYSFAIFKTKFCYLNTYRQRICNNAQAKFVKYQWSEK